MAEAKKSALNEMIGLLRQDLKPTSEDGFHEKLFHLVSGLMKEEQEHASLELVPKLGWSISVMQYVVTTTRRDHPDLGIWLYCLSDLFEMQGKLHEEQPIAEMCAKAVHEANIPSEAFSNIIRHEAKIAQDNSINAALDAVFVTPRDSQHRAELLENLGRKLMNYYKLHGRIDILDLAIDIFRDVVNSFDGFMTPSTTLGTMSNLFGLRAKALGSIDDMNEAIKKAREAVDTAKKAVGTSRGGELTFGKALHNLGIQLERRFEWFGDETDLVEAIEVANEATRSVPEGHEDYPQILDGLGTKCGRLFELRNDMTVLTSAITYGRQAVGSVAETSALRGTVLIHLSNMLEMDFQRTANSENLEESIQLAQEAVKVTSSSILIGGMLQNLSKKIFTKFLSTHDKMYLDKATKIAQQACHATPKNHPDLAARFHNLSLMQVSSVDQTKNEEQLKRAIQCARKAVLITPEDHPARAERLSWLANIFRQRVIDAIKATRKPNKHVMAYCTLLYKKAKELPNAPPLPRVLAASNGGLMCAYVQDWEGAKTFFQDAVKLLPRVARRSLNRRDQQHVLETLHGISPLAASTVLRARGDPSEALETLEAGRGIMANLLVDSRSEISDLAESNSILHKQYVKLRDAAFPSSVWDRSESHATPAPEAIIRTTYILRELHAVESKIRSLPGFKRFQQPLTAQDFKDLARSGPIVSFNVTEYSSEAFIVTSKNIEVCPLLELKLEDLEANVNLLVGKGKLSEGDLDSIRSRNEKMREILKWLWDKAVYPVLKHLGLLRQADQYAERLPRLWWVTSGLVGLTPLHAAGSRWTTGISNTVSHVVSSYIPSFKALEYAREKARQSSGWRSHNFSIIAMPKTTHRDDLNALQAVPEIREILERFGLPGIDVLDTPSSGEVLNALEAASAAIFACHGESYLKDPSDSCLLLKDSLTEKPGRLTVHQLVANPLKHLRLVCLLACSTAENRSLRLLDEVIHIASAFLLVGTPHVLGTLWPVGDDVANEIARSFILELCDKGRLMEPESPDVFAYALHDVMKTLRKDIWRDVISWAPFVYFGC